MEYKIRKQWNTNIVTQTMKIKPLKDFSGIQGAIIPCVMESPPPPSIEVFFFLKDQEVRFSGKSPQEIENLMCGWPA